MSNFSKKVALYPCILLVIIAITLLYGVLNRYGLKGPYGLAFEAPMLLLVHMVAFSMAYVQVLNGNVAVTLLVDRTAPKMQRIIRIFGLMVFFVYCMFLVWVGIGLVSHFVQSGIVTNEARMPVGLWSIAIPLGFGMLGAQVLADIIKEWRAGNKAAGSINTQNNPKTTSPTPH